MRKGKDQTKKKKKKNRITTPNKGSHKHKPQHTLQEEDKAHIS
jgi:hypothetical protein